jgi:hypothetical protein
MKWIAPVLAGRDLSLRPLLAFVGPPVFLLHCWYVQFASPIRNPREDIT